MDEPRDQPADAAPRAPKVAAASRLSPVQQAWAAFVRHVTRDCDTCRDIDVPNCGQAEQLHRDWRAADAEAHRRLNGESAFPAGQ